MKTRNLMLASSVMVLTACGGLEPNPISSYQIGDNAKSCSFIQAEISDNEAQIERLLPGEDAIGKNVALGVTGDIRGRIDDSGRVEAGRGSRSIVSQGYGGFRRLRFDLQFNGETAEGSFSIDSANGRFCGTSITISESA